MARIIRFPLKMKNGIEVRTIEELRENFDVESVLGYYVDGTLRTWLEDRYYDDKALCVTELDPKDPELGAKLCKILEVEFIEDENACTDFQIIQRKKEKLRILSAYTDDNKILENIDNIAFTQDELFEMLIKINNHYMKEPSDNSKIIQNIFLYGDMFEIPFKNQNINYIGVNNPVVVLEKSIYEYNDENIWINDTTFDDKIKSMNSAYVEKLFISGDYKKAFPLIKKEANSGNPRAMYLMARYYNDGYEVVKIDNSSRNMWCEKAIKYKEPISTYGYAVWNLKGDKNASYTLFRGIAPDILRFANSGDVLAQTILGYMYKFGKGVEKNRSASHKWYQSAANLGDSTSQYNLGLLYKQGKGIEKDYKKSLKWLSLSAEKGNVNAQRCLGQMYGNGEFSAENNDSDSNDPMTVLNDFMKWSKRAAFQGDLESQVIVGEMCLLTDIDEAINWLTAPANHGNIKAQSSLGVAYLTKENIDDAFKWFSIAANNGDTDAQYQLGELYRYGRGVERDTTEAKKWLSLAAEKGNDYAKMSLESL